MLQLKRISQVLAQGLVPVTESETSRPLAISLLASSGLPLATVTSTELETELTLSSDNVKIYSLLGVNYLRQQASDDSQEVVRVQSGQWTIVTLDKKLKLAIALIRDDPMYVTILYDDNVLDAVAKLKLDNLCETLTKGLEGY